METLFNMLGFTPVKEKLAQYALTERGQTNALDLKSFLPENIYTDQQKLSLEMRNILAVDHIPGIIGFPVQDDILDRIRVENASMDIQELYTTVRIMRHARLVWTYFQEKEETYPRLAALSQKYDPDLKAIEKSIARIFDPEGLIADHASPELHRLRKKINKLESGIRVKVSQIAGDWLNSQIASDNTVSFKNGRHVIPVRASRKSKAPGIIHDQSHTGQTLYVEPLIIVEMNNELYQAQHEEKLEIRRILAEKTALLRDYIHSLADAIYLLEQCDIYHSRAKLALEYDCDKPLNEENFLQILNGRNLELNFTRTPVPLNLRMPEGKNGIIITGPNAGGKTVTLKTVGLLALMNQSGLLIPAQALTSLPQYDAIFADIGDGQSIDGGMSTFSSHILSLKNILDHATDKSLVLVDELGTGTDPDEGAALAEGVLQILSERGTSVIATTHHSALKTLAFNNPRYENGSMTFQDRTLEPTYEFVMGIPGSSYAIDIAQRFELDPRVIAIAKERVGKQREKLERLIIDLQRKITRHNDKLKEMKERERILGEEQKIYAKKKKEIEAKYKKAEKEAVKRADMMLIDLRRELEAAIQDIKENQAGKVSIKRAQSTFQGTAQQLDQKREQFYETPKGHLHFDNIQKDMTVFVTSMGQNGKVLEVNKKTRKIWVDIDGSRLRLSADWLEAAKEKKQQVNTFISRSYSGSNYRLDLRGKRAEEAMDELDKFMDNAVACGLNHVEILHGTGGGVLQKIVHDMLKQDYRAKKYDFALPEHGGVGVTLVELS